MNSCIRFLHFYFYKIWPPFILYLMIYLWARFTHIAVIDLTTIFRCLHALNLILLVISLINGFKTREINWKTLVLWGVIGGLLFLPGVYLEYPSDPWEHFRRIMSWQYTEFIHQSEIKNKFAYYFSWTLITDLPIESRRMGLGVVAAFWQLVLALQLGALLKACKLDYKSRWVALTGWVCFFGTGIFGMRYYALSSTPLAMLGMFGAYICIIDAVEKKPKHLFSVPLLMVLMGLNHSPQELCNFIIGASGIISIFSWQKLEASKKLILRKYLLVFISLVFIFGTLLNLIGPDWHVAFRKVRPALGFLGGVPFTPGGPRILSTLGLHGIFGVICALLLLKKSPYLSALTLAPVAFLLFPLTAQLLMLVGGPSASFYRLLYGFPASITFCVYLYQYLEKKQKRFALPFSLGIIVIMGLLFFRPVFGRLFFQVYPQDRLHALEPLDETAQWFLSHRKSHINNPNCTPMMDAMTNFFLSTQLGIPHHGIGRLNPIRELIVISERRTPLFYLDREKACGVLVPDVNKLPHYKASFIGKTSKHWNVNLVDLRYSVPKDINILLDLLKSDGWTRTLVPPFYEYWEPKKTP